MLDTKLKKTHKLTTLIIILCVLLPALILTALYPQMEKAAIKQKEEYIEAAEKMSTEPEPEYMRELDSGFDNMATEAAFYIYGTLLREKTGAYVDMSVLEDYGWIDDYYMMRDTTDFYAELIDYTDDAGTTVREPEEDSMSASEAYTYTNAGWDMANLLDMDEEDKLTAISKMQMENQGYLQLEFNAYGEISNVEMWMPDDVWVENDLYGSVRETIAKYRNNAEVWAYNHDADVVAVTDSLVPKNFRVVFVLEETHTFVYDYWEEYGYYAVDWTSLYVDTGAMVPVIALAVLVALAALLLPFIKKLETGWEKLFCIPFEIIAVLTFFGCLGASGMFIVMCESNLSNLNAITETNGPFNLIGYELSNQVVYGGLLFVNFLGWAACFLAEYVVVASFRQFLCRPVYYLKERVLCIRFFRWIKKQCIRFYRYVTEIDIHENLHGSIVKIVLVNFAILALLCCLWWFGLAGLIAYSIALYVLLRKFGQKVQTQYESIFDATHQMAEGNLKISIEEDLGIFKPLGQELEKVQQGFSKAVIEEAKSQNMKTELITNVSHDLKTPLTAIITYIELLKKEDITEEEQKSYIATIDQKSQRLKVLIDDLFEVSKATSGNIQMNFMDVDVVNLMKQVRLEMEEKFAESDLSFRWNLPEERLVLSLDGQKTYRVFENLLNNVLKYSLPHSRVYVDILDMKTHVKVVFRNISAVELSEDPDHLTDRFVRGDASRQTEGSGLGLAIVKSFVELQHGKLDVSIDGDLFKVSILWQK